MTAQLEKIVQACLECPKMEMGEAACNVVGLDMIKFTFMRVSSSGDVRRFLDIYRSGLSYPFVPTGLGKPLNCYSCTVELVHFTQEVTRVREVKKVILLV